MLGPSAAKWCCQPPNNNKCLLPPAIMRVQLQVYVQPSLLGWKPIVQSWMQKLPEVITKKSRWARLWRKLATRVVVHARIPRTRAPLHACLRIDACIDTHTHTLTLTNTHAYAGTP